MRSFLLRIACLYIRSHVINQMTKAGWKQSSSNPAHWETPPTKIDGVTSTSSVHVSNASSILVADMINSFLTNEK
jgi:hypothetical protein